MRILNQSDGDLRLKRLLQNIFFCIECLKCSSSVRYWGFFKKKLGRMSVLSLLLSFFHFLFIFLLFTSLFTVDSSDLFPTNIGL